MFYLLLILGYLIYVTRYVVLLISFIFGSYGLFILSKDQRLKFLSFVPIARYYLFSKLTLKTPRWTYFLLPVELTLTTIIKIFHLNYFIFQLFDIVVFFQKHLLFYFLYRLYRPKKALKYTIWGVLFSPLDDFFVFLIRNRRRKDYY